MAVLADVPVHDVVRAAVGRDLLVEAARLLREVGVRLVPLKGIYLQHFAYEAPELRPISDVDVLVAEQDYGRVRACFRAAGWSWDEPQDTEAVAQSPDHALPLDVHCQLFARGAFDLSGRDVLDRAVPDRERFGVEVLLPDPLDVLAHLVGHFVKSRAAADDTVHVADFERLGRAHALEPGHAARHLQATGLARAARYALRYAADVAPDGFAVRVLGALAPDPVGAALASTSRTLRRHVPRRSAVAALPGFLLEPTLARGVGGALRRMRRAGAVSASSEL